jgi:hypothetical protein
MQAILSHTRFHCRLYLLFILRARDTVFDSSLQRGGLGFYFTSLENPSFSCNFANENNFYLIHLI